MREKGTAAHSSVLAWRVSCTEEPGGLLSIGSRLKRLSSSSSSKCASIIYHSRRTKEKKWFQFSSVAHSYQTLQPHGLQHTRLPCPSPTPRVYSNSCPLCWWCHPTISPSVVPFIFCLQSFPASGSFPMSQFFSSGGQSIGATTSASVLPVNNQDWFPLGLTGWISLQSKGLSSLLQHHSSKSSILQCSAFFIVQLSHPYMTTGKTTAVSRFTFICKVMSLLFNMLFRWVIAFLPVS